MSDTRIKRCSCAHVFQDKKYGKGRRVFNVGKNGDKAKCTVCNKEVRLR